MKSSDKPTTPLPNWETSRCILRVPDLVDLHALIQLYGDAEVMRYIGDGQIRSSDQILSGLAWMIEQHKQDGFGLWIVQLKDSGEIIGRCGLIRQTIEARPEVEIAYMLTRAHWGKGLATEIAQGIYQQATHHLGLERLISLIHPQNMASKRVAQKTGLQFEREVLFGNMTVDLYSNQNTEPERN